jgi:replicative DNA helicase
LPRSGMTPIRPVRPLVHGWRSPRDSAERCGHFPIGVSVLHGPPGSAKTALANQLAAEAGCPALIVTCEMSPVVLLQRQTARVTRTHISKFSTGELAPDLCRALVIQTIEAMPDLAILDATRAPVSMTFLRESATVTRDVGESGHLLIVIDSMHSFVRRSGAARDGIDDRIATNQAIDALQQLAAELRCSILIIAEQNRASQGSDRQEAAADTRVFEYAAELIIALSRDRTIREDALGEFPVTATLAKNRHGSPGTVIDLRFSGRFMTFREGDGSINVVAGGRNGLTNGKLVIVHR